MAVKKATTWSGVPVNFARRSSRWVAIPVGHVSRWHWRAMSQPIATSAAVPKPYSSAPSSAAIDHVAPGLQPAVGAQHDPIPQPVADQDLVHLGQAELPRQAGVLDGAQRRGAGASGVTGDHHVVGVRLRHPGRDGADAGAGHQLHADPRPRVDGPQVADELRQVLDRVDVVVRRRADHRHARLAATQAGDEGRRLLARAAALPRRASSPARS